MQILKQVLTCKVLDILALVLESICGPRNPLVLDLPIVPREKPKSSWYASSSICKGTTYFYDYLTYHMSRQKEAMPMFFFCFVFFHFIELL